MAVVLHSPRGWHGSMQGRRYTVVVSGIPAGADTTAGTRWFLALHKAASAAGVYVTWVYLTGNQTYPVTAVPLGAIIKLEFIIPPTVTPGTYNFRFHAYGGAVVGSPSPNFSIAAFGA